MSLFIRYGIWAAQGTPDLNQITAMISLFSVATTEVFWHNYELEESLTASVSDISVWVRYAGDTVPVSAQNIESTTDQWGNRIGIIFDHDITNGIGQEAKFTVTDTASHTYLGTATAIVETYPYNVLWLDAQDFNASVGDLTVHYTDASGGLQGGVGQSISSFNVTFTPINLGAPEVPGLEAIWNE